MFFAPADPRQNFTNYHTMGNKDNFLTIKTTPDSANHTTGQYTQSLAVKLLFSFLILALLAGNLAAQQYTVCLGTDFHGDLLDHDDYESTTPPVFSLISGPATGNLYLQPDGKFTYQGTVSGTFSFTYQVDVKTGELIIPDGDCAHVQTMQVVYLGTGASVVVVFSKVTPGQGEPVIPSIYAEFENVQYGDTLSIIKDHSGAPGLGLNWDFEVDGEIVVSINTACGIDLLGKTFGDFLIVGVDGYTIEEEVLTYTETATLTVLEAVCPEDIAVCIDELPVTLEGGMPEDGVYSGDGVSVENGSYVFNTEIPGDYTIIYSVAGDDCVSTCQFTITVHALPNAEITPDGDLEFCEGGSVTLSVSESDAYLWSNGETTRSITVSESGNFYVTVTDENGCSATSEEVTITVHELPVVALEDFNAVCEDVEAFALTGGTPAGGDYAGTGVENGMFDPAVAGPGTHTIIYSYTDANGCTNTATASITVYSLPEITLADFGPVCEDADTFDLLGESPSGGTYSGTGVQGGQFVPAVAGVGTHTIAYAYTDENGCTASATTSITVHALPVVTCPEGMNVYLDDAPFALTGAEPAGGTYSGDGVSGNQFNPAAAGLGSHLITYTYHDGHCSATCTFFINVNEDLTVDPFCDLQDDTFTACAGETLNGDVSENDDYFSLGDAVFSLLTQPASGTLTFNADGTFSYVPGQPGEYTFNYQLTIVTGDGDIPTGECAQVQTMQVIYLGDDANVVQVTSKQTPGVGAPVDPSVYGTFTDVQTGDVLTIIKDHSGAPGLGLNWEFEVDGTTAATMNTACGINLLGNTYGPFRVIAVDDYSLGSGTETETCTATVTLTVPGASCPGDIVVCMDELPVVLGGATPAGGAYAGNGVSLENGSFIFDAQAAGVYTITYNVSSDGCDVSCSFTVTVNALPVVELSGTDVACFGDDSGEISVTVSGGNAPYAVSLDGENWIDLAGSTHAFENLPAGEYTVWSRDENGCPASDDITIGEPEQLVVNAGQDDEISFGETFTMNANATGNGPFTYAWAPAALLQNPAVLNPVTVALTETVTFTLTVTDANGCVASDQVTITVSGEPLTVDPAASPASICFGDASQLSANANGGAGVLTYRWTSDPEGFVSTDENPSVSPEVTTTYFITVTDEMDNSADASVTVTVNPIPEIECPVYGPVCVGSGTIVFTEPGVFSIGGQAVTGFDPASPGTYTFLYTFTSEAGCVATCEFDIEVLEQPEVSCAGFSRTVCLSTGNFSLSGNMAPAGVFSGDYVTANTFMTLDAGPGTHTVTYTVTDPETGCTNSCTFTVTVLEAPEFTITKSLASVNGDASLTRYSAAGDVISFSLVVENTGELALNNIVISDPGTTIQSGSPTATLQPGETTTVIATYVVTAADVIAGSISNTAFGTAGSSCGQVTATSNTLVVEAEPFGDITVTKTSDAETYSIPGAVITYTIVVENTGNMVLTDVRVTDPMTGLETVIPNLIPGDLRTFTETYAVTQADLERGEIVNTASASGTGTGEQVFTGSDSASSSAVILTAALDIVKSADASRVAVGEEITYTIEVSNNNPIAAVNVVVTDALPEGVSFISASHDGDYAEGTHAVTWSLGNIAADDMVSLTLVVQANTDLADNSTVINVAIAENDNADFPAESNPAQVSITAMADLMILKGADVGTAYNNQEITYTLTVTNVGPSVAANVVVHDLLPPQVEFVSATQSGSYNPNNRHVTWTLGNMGAGESFTLNVVTSVSSGIAQGVSITNFATVTSETADPDPLNNEANLTVISAGALADLSVVKQADRAEVQPGDTFTYTITVTNNGPSDASFIGVVDYLPGEATFVSAGQNGSYSSSTQTVSWTIDFLAAGESMTLTLEMELGSHVAGATILTNEVTVQSDLPDPDMSNNTYILQTPVGIPPLFIPDVFTPNNDGINDKWVIRGLAAYPNSKVVIINRWGNRVFEAAPYNNDWDGTNRFSPNIGGNELPVGTYYYILDLGPNEPQRTGYIYLAR